MDGEPEGEVIHEILDCDVLGTYEHEGKTETYFEEDQALAYLLATENCILAKRKAGGLAILVVCNDVFAWGYSDLAEIDRSELKELYEMVRKDKGLGAAVWCCKKRGSMPQGPVAAEIRKAGIWPIDEMGLEPNWYDKACRESAAKRNAEKAA